MKNKNALQNLQTQMSKDLVCLELMDNVANNKIQLIEQAYQKAYDLINQALIQDKNPE
jgi:Mg2+ and Co2+ transporter CorA